MGGFRVEAYDKQGYPRDWNRDWGVYAAFAPRGEAGDALVKIGVSCDVYNRIGSLRAGCPYPIQVTLWAGAGKRETAYAIESALHKIFADRCESGEWFAFNLADKADKQAFHGVTKMVFSRHTGWMLTWQRITAEQVNAFAALTAKKSRKAKGGQHLTRAGV
jgi:hypothetical protein